MEKRIFVISVILSMFSSLASTQSGYMQGYIMTGTGDRVNCWINMDKIEANPLKLEYRLDKNSEAIYASAVDVKEFGVPEHTRYIRSVISPVWLYENIDSTDFNNPGFKDNSYIFLRTIVEGKASVYSFDYKKKKIYFYRIDESRAEELITLDNPESIEEKGIKVLYRNQLAFTLEAPGILQHDIQYLKYDDGDLSDLFNTYNQGMKSKSINYNNLIKHNLFKVRIKGELRYSLLSARGGTSNIETLDMSNRVNSGFDIESEMVFPWFNRRISLLLEPSYHRYRNSTLSTIQFTLADAGEENTIKVNYNTINIAFGIKVNLLSTSKGKIAIAGKAITSIPLESKWLKDDEVLFKMPWADISPAAAISYEHGKMTVELAYYLSTDLILANPRWDSRFRSFSLSFGYTILGSGN